MNVIANARSFIALFNFIKNGPKPLVFRSLTKGLALSDNLVFYPPRRRRCSPEYCARLAAPAFGASEHFPDLLSVILLIISFDRLAYPPSFGLLLLGNFITAQRGLPGYPCFAQAVLYARAS
jgi:hypothetical protein